MQVFGAPKTFFLCRSIASMIAETGPCTSRNFRAVAPASMKCMVLEESETSTVGDSAGPPRRPNKQADVDV